MEILNLKEMEFPNLKEKEFPLQQEIGHWKRYGLAVADSPVGSPTFISSRIYVACTQYNKHTQNKYSYTNLDTTTNFGFDTSFNSMDSA